MELILSESAKSQASTTLAVPARTGAVVMGGDYRGLALVRSLGRCGIPVWVIKQDDQLLAATSRYACRSLYHRSWYDGDGVNFLTAISRQHNLKDWLLFPTSDESVRLVAEHHKELSRFFQLTVPPWEQLQWAVDKRLMQQLADKLQIDHPQSFYPDCREDLLNLKLSFPVLLKPTTRDQFNRLSIAKVWRADDMETLLAQFDCARRFLPARSLMIQELIPGGGEFQFSYTAVCKDGLPLARLIARRTRQYPMDFGRASTFVETIEDKDVVEPSERFLRAIRYTGIVEVEFKKDARTGRFKLLDINPRVWGWYSLCEQAGVNFGHLLWLLHQGETLPEVRARPGVRWIRLTTDMLTAFREIRAGRMAIGDYLRSLRGPKESAIFVVDDPTPGLLEVPLLFLLLFKRLLRGKGV